MVRTRHEAHAANFPGDRTEGEPSAHLSIRIETPIAQILVPADEAFGARFLDEEGAAPNQNVRPDDLFNHVKDARMADEPIGEAKDDVRIVELGPVAEPAVTSPVLQRFQFPLRRAGLVRTQHIDGKDVAVGGVAGRELGVGGDSREGDCR